MRKNSIATVLSFMSIVLFVTAIQATAQGMLPPKCQILDNHDNPLYEVGFGYASKADVGDDGEYGETGLVKLYGLVDGGYYRDVLGGDIDLHLYGGAVVVSDRTLLRIPNQLVDINFDIGWTWRTLSATAIQAHFKPGIYSDFEEFSSSALFMPFSVAVVQSFSDDLSGIIGVEVRPRFDLVAMPIVGLVWQPSPDVRVEATLPVANISWEFEELWRAYCGFDWINKTYDIREKRGLAEEDREQVTFEDFRLYAGVARELNDYMTVVGELGSLFNRSIYFKKDVDPDVDQDVDMGNSVFLRLAIRGAF